jgi:hypothetical protein
MDEGHDKGRMSGYKWTHADLQRLRARVVSAPLHPPRPAPKGMNKTEAAYAQQLERQRLAGEIQDWMYEPIKLFLAKATTYTPDFMVKMVGEEIHMVEVKGFMRDDAAVKIKVAADKYQRFYRFVLVRKVKGGWDEKLIL